MMMPLLCSYVKDLLKRNNKVVKILLTDPYLEQDKGNNGNMANH